MFGEYSQGKTKEGWKDGWKEGRKARTIYENVANNCLKRFPPPKKCFQAY
jgi:hypothetical protein